MHFCNKYLAPLLALTLAACSSADKTATTSEGAATSGSGHSVLVNANPPAGPGIKGTGHLTTETRKTDQFHAIKMLDLAHVEVHVGTPLSLSVTVDDNLQSAVDTKQENGILTLSINKSFQTVREPYITIAVPELNDVKIEGAGDMIVDGIKGDIFNIESTGSGNFKGSGFVINEKIVHKGSGNVDCQKVQADNINIDSSGSGKSVITANKSLSAKLSGSGTIKYGGTANSINKNATGSGTILPL